MSTNALENSNVLLLPPAIANLNNPLSNLPLSLHHMAACLTIGRNVTLMTKLHHGFESLNILSMAMRQIYTKVKPFTFVLSVFTVVPGKPTIIIMNTMPNALRKLRLLLKNVNPEAYKEYLEQKVA